jgi:hypothetical protein
VRLRVVVIAAVSAFAVTLIAAPTAPAQEAQPPACTPDTPSALRFVGLPSKIPFGREQEFSLDSDGDAWDLTGAISVTMRSGTRTLYEDTTTDELEDLYLRLDLGDEAVTVTASFEQTEGFADDPVPCVRTVTAHTGGYRHFGLIDRCDEPSYRPRSIRIACGDGNFGLTGLSWRGWNHAVATARGKAYANDCVPYCAAGRFHRYPVRVRAYRLRTMGEGDYAYTRLRISFPGPRPAGAPRVQVRKAGEDGIGFFWR